MKALANFLKDYAALVRKHKMCFGYDSGQTPDEVWKIPTDDDDVSVWLSLLEDEQLSPLDGLDEVGKLCNP